MMHMVTIIVMFVLGVCGASHLIVRHTPQLAGPINKLQPYQGWLGVLCATWGAWWTIRFLINLRLLAVAPLTMIIWLVTALVCLALGLLLGADVLKSFVKMPAATAKLDLATAKLAPYRGTLGLASMGLAALALIRS